MRAFRRTRTRRERLARRGNDLWVRVYAAVWFVRRFWRHGKPRRLARR
jgi:hypothetical protein